jgi:hypothetical protein
MSPRKRRRGWNPSKLRGPRRRPATAVPVQHPSPAGPRPLQQLRERGQQQMAAEAVARERARHDREDRLEAHVTERTEDRLEAHVTERTKDGPMLGAPVWREHRSGTTTTGG